MQPSIEGSTVFSPTKFFKALDKASSATCRGAGTAGSLVPASSVSGGSVIAENAPALPFETGFTGGEFGDVSDALLDDILKCKLGSGK